MPICIECSYPVSHLYTSYSKADDRSLGRGVRLTQCPRCKRFADKYVEHDFVVLFIDLVLIKPQVYRHLLFNRLGRDDNKFDRSIIRLGILLLLFDVYLTWARLEKSSALSASSLSEAPIVVQYLFFLSLNGLATLAHHLAIRLLTPVMIHRNAKSSSALNDTVPSTPSTPLPSSNTSSFAQNPSYSSISPKVSRPTSSSGNHSYSNSNNAPSSLGPLPPLRRASTAPPRSYIVLPPSPPSPSAISTALLVSSCTKLFPILLVIWGADLGTDMPINNPLTQPSRNGSSVVAPLVRAITSQATSTMTGMGSEATSAPASHPGSRFGSGSGSTTGVDAGGPGWPFLKAFLSLSITNTHLVLLNNIEALMILLDCGYVRAIALALAGQTARWVVETGLLSAVGIR